MQSIFRLILISAFLSIISFASIFASDNRSASPVDTITGSRRFEALMMSKIGDGLMPIPLAFDTTILLGKKLTVKVRSLKIVAVGDVMPGTNYPFTSYLPASCSDLFNPVKDIISNADVAIANLEGVFSSDGGTPKNCKDPKTCYVFRMPDEYAKCIMDAGFDILGVANNHVNDFGFQGRQNTAKLLDELAIPFAGFFDRTSVIYESNGIKIGFCAFAPHTGTLDLKDYEGASRLVAELKLKTDIVIVYFHGGAEGRDHQNLVKDDEVYLGHNRGNTYHFAHTVIDAGADLVVGSGPHVVRAIEIYKGKMIAYSLGNFCTYRRFNLSGPNAYAPILEVELDENGNLLSAGIHSFLQLGEGGPVIDTYNTAANKILELSKQDFPNQKLDINAEGQIIWIE